MKKPIIGFVQAPNYDNKVVAVKAPVRQVQAKTFVLSPNGTLITREDLYSWDKDKLNGAGE